MSCISINHPLSGQKSSGPEASTENIHVCGKFPARRAVLPFLVATPAADAFPRQDLESAGPCLRWPRGTWRGLTVGGPLPPMPGTGSESRPSLPASRHPEAPPLSPTPSHPLEPLSGNHGGLSLWRSLAAGLPASRSHRAQDRASACCSRLRNAPGATVPLLTVSLPKPRRDSSTNGETEARSGEAGPELKSRRPASNPSL